MITDWDELDGREITGTCHGSGGVVLLLGDEFAVVTAEMGYHRESAHPILASLDDEDALHTAALAQATGAYDLLQNAKHRRIRKVEDQERRRLKYLQERYG